MHKYANAFTKFVYFQEQIASQDWLNEMLSTSVMLVLDSM